MGLSTPEATSAAFPSQASAGSYDAYVRKLNASGGETWTRQFGTAGFDETKGLSTDSAGNVFAIGLAGSTLPGQVSAGSSDVLVSKYDPSGAESGTSQFGTSGSDNVLAGAGDAGAVYAAGYTNGTFAGQAKSGYWDAFVIKFQANATPALTVSQGSLTVPEGSTMNSGAFSDADLGDNVSAHRGNHHEIRRQRGHVVLVSGCRRPHSRRP